MRRSDVVFLDGVISPALHECELLHQTCPLLGPFRTHSYLDGAVVVCASLTSANSAVRRNGNGRSYTSAALGLLGGGLPIQHRVQDVVASEDRHQLPLRVAAVVVGEAGVEPDRPEWT
jgi:hypothetical protein